MRVKNPHLYPFLRGPFQQEVTLCSMIVLEPTSFNTCLQKNRGSAFNEPFQCTLHGRLGERVDGILALLGPSLFG
jgi:hypothetical protein